MHVRVEGVTPHYQEIRVLPPIAALNDFHPSIYTRFTDSPIRFVEIVGFRPRRKKRKNKLMNNPKLILI